MVFAIRTASHKFPPCDEAYKGEPIIINQGDDWVTYRYPYLIQIDSMDQLMDLVGKYGELIVDENEIIIYDDYME